MKADGLMEQSTDDLLSRREPCPQEVRPHISYFQGAYTAAGLSWAPCYQRAEEQFRELLCHAEDLRLGDARIYGLIFKSGFGWVRTKDAQSPAGEAILRQAIAFAAQHAHISHCTTVRVARGVKQLKPLTH